MVEKSNPKAYTVHMIGNAHIDPIWLWRLEEGRKEVSDTCRSALDRMKETPGFIFVRSSASSYVWLEEDAPDMFEEVRKRIKEGRWEIVNGWWEQPDCNIPGGESYVRHALYAKEYFMEKFGVEPTVGYNVDTFGHNGNLPQILAKSGFKSYIFFRPGEHEKHLPQHFWWESPDGSRVLGIRPPHHYGFGGNVEEIKKRIVTAWEQTDDGVTEVMCFYGVGNHGGGPTKLNIQGILETDAMPDTPNAKFARCDAYVEKVLAQKTDFPVVKDDLQIHAVGCYTAVSAVKVLNRRAEQKLMAAERFATVANLVSHKYYPGAELRDAWRDVLFNQFHDVLAGTSIHPAYEDTYAMFAKAIETADVSQRASLRAIATNIDTRGKNLALVAFNPNPWRRKDLVTADVEVAVVPKLVRLVADDDSEVPVQIAGVSEAGDKSTVTVMFVAELPALGFRVFRLHLDEMPSFETPMVCAHPNGLSNDVLSLVVDPYSGGLVSLRAGNGPELIAAPGANFVVIKDHSDTWSHGITEFRNELGRFIANGRIRVVSQGPVRATLEVVSSFEDSTLVQHFHVYPGINRVDVDVKMDFRERHRMVKLAVPTALDQITATAEIPYTYMERDWNGEELPGQKWIDVTGKVDRARFGVTMLNDGRYGFDVKESEMRMSVLRTPIYAFHDPRKVNPKETYQYPDLGTTSFRYALIPHGGDWRAIMAPRAGDEFNTPTVAFIEPHHNGALKSGAEFLEVGPDNVVGMILKRTQEYANGNAADDRIIVRLYEGHGLDGIARVRLPFLGIAAEVPIGHHEIKTLAFDVQNPSSAPVEVDLLERPIP